MRATLFLCLMSLTSTALAQDMYQTKGFSLGVSASALSWSLDNPELDLSGSNDGAGLGLDASYGVSKLVTIRFNVDASSVSVKNEDPYPVAHADLGVRFLFGGLQRRVKPFAQVLISGVAAEQDFRFYDLEMAGGGASIGGGVLYFFSPAFALDSELLLMAGTLNDVKVDGHSMDVEIDQQSARLKVGVRWYPGR